MNISVFMEHIFDASIQENRSVSEILKEIKKYGIRGIELDYGRIVSDDTLPELIKSKGLGIACVYAFFDFPHNSDFSYPEKVISDLTRHGIKKLMPIPGFIEKDDDYEKSLTDMYRTMNKLSSLAEKNGISVCLEDFDDERAVFSTAKGLKGFIDNVNGLGCTFDTGNFIYSGENEQEAFNLLMDSIVHIHCKDRITQEKIGEEPKISLKNLPLYSSPVGYGIIGIEQIVKTMLRKGYDGWFAIEHFGSQNQLSDIKKSAEKLKEWYNDTCNNME